MTFRKEVYLANGDRVRELAKEYPDKFIGVDVEAAAKRADEHAAERELTRRKILEPANQSE